VNVERVMKRDVRACRTDDTLNRAAQLMWDNACGCVPIVSERDQPIGILTDRDICMAALHARPAFERDYGSNFDGPQSHHLSH
jgi:predicted transcriptional regulator